MEHEETSDKINYLRFAAGILFLNAAGALCSGKRSGAAPAKIEETAPVSDIAQEEVVAAQDY